MYQFHLQTGYDYPPAFVDRDVTLEGSASYSWPPPAYSGMLLQELEFRLPHTHALWCHISQSLPPSTSNPSIHLPKSCYASWPYRYPNSA